MRWVWVLTASWLTLNPTIATDAVIATEIFADAIARHHYVPGPLMPLWRRHKMTLLLSNWAPPPLPPPHSRVLLYRVKPRLRQTGSGETHFPPSLSLSLSFCFAMPVLPLWGRIIRECVCRGEGLGDGETYRPPSWASVISPRLRRFPVLYIACTVNPSLCLHGHLALHLTLGLSKS